MKPAHRKCQRIQSSTILPILVATTGLFLHAAAVAQIAPFGTSCDLARGPAKIPPNPAYSQWPLTVECRVKLDRQDQYNIIIANETKASPRHWELFTSPKNGILCAYLAGFKPSLLNSGVCITDGKWHALTMIVEETRVRLFVDGELKKEQAAAAPAAPALGQELRLGALVEGNLNCNGQIDEIRLSNCVRPVGGIPAAPFTADANTIGLWQFEDQTLGKAKDASRLQNHAKLPLPDLGALFEKTLDLSKGTVGIPIDSSFEQRPLTIDCWVKLPKQDNAMWKSQGNQVLFAYGSPYDIPSQSCWQLDLRRGTPQFYIPGQCRMGTRTVIMDGKWHHLALVLERSRARLLVDGNETVQAAISPLKTTADPLICQPSEVLTVGGLPNGLRRSEGEVGVLRVSKGIRAFEDLPHPPLATDDQTLGLWQFAKPGQKEFLDRSGHNRTARFKPAPMPVNTDCWPLPEKVPPEPLRKAAAELAEKLDLKMIDPFNVRDEVWQKWAFDFYWYGRFDYDRPTHFWNKEAAESQVFDRQALVLPEDGGPDRTVLRQTGALIEDLRKTAAGDSDKLTRLDALAADLAKVAKSDPGLARYLAACMVRRQVAFSNPLLDFNSILCVARGSFEGSIRSNPITTDYQGGHFTTQFFGFNALPGGGLYIVKNWKTDPTVINVLENSMIQNGRLKGRKLDHGAFCTPDLSYDGKTIVFAWTANPDHDWSYSEERMWHLFKVGVDGTGLIQLTDGAYDDFDPCWLPDGRIAFVSERRGGHIRCFSARNNVRNYTLFSMREDGTDIIPISYYETSEWNPSVNNDGMLIYTRWDYTDRENCLGSRFWISGPDGTDPRAPHGNYPLPFDTLPNYAPWTKGGRDSRFGTPVAEMGIRAIPNSHRYIFTGAPHHGEAYGSLGILDLRIEDDGHMSQIKRLTPGEAFPEMEFGMRGHYKYGTPWPLSENFYLCNIWNNLALLDRFGNEELVCDLRRIPARPDERLRLIDPIPLRPRPVPPALVPRTNQGEEAQSGTPKATLSVVNVYDSDLPFPHDRKIKWLRVVQNILKSNHTMGKPMIGYERENTPRIPLGIVPVEADGSVYFEAPVAKELILQPLDENFMAVQSMRTVAFVHPGEQLSCQGCHEPKNQAPPVLQHPPLAMQRAPSKLEPEIGPIEPISYYRQIKPVFENSCIPCHKEKGEGPSDMSYKALKEDTFWFSGGMWGSMATEYSGIHGGSRSIPGRFGAAYSKIGKALLDDTHRTAVSEEDRHKVIVWLDCNSLRLTAYIREGEQLQGKLVWPTLDVDPANPQGIDGTTPSLKHNFWHENLYGPHAFLGTSHKLGKIYLMDKQGRMVWDYPVPNPQDVWMLPNGNILTTWLHGVKEVTRDKQVVWEFNVEAPNEVPTCQPLPNGNVLIGVVGQCRLVEVDRKGQIVHEIQLETSVKKPHAQFRMCRQTPEGTYLVPFTAEGAVREYSHEGRMLRQFPQQKMPVCALRLPDGNTLITADQCVTEYDQSNRVVWQMTSKDVPDINLAILAGVQRRSNGNTVVCNWNAKPDGAKAGAHIFEITPDKRVVWQVDTNALGKVAQCQLLTSDLLPLHEEIWR